MANPYYEPKKLNLEMLTFEADLGYEFDIIAFFATQNGNVYFAQDSGCSCPTPFEDFDKESQDECLQLMERVANCDHAERLFDSWVYRDPNDKKALTSWISEKLK